MKGEDDPLSDVERCTALSPPLAVEGGKAQRFRCRKLVGHEHSKDELTAEHRAKAVLRWMG